MDELAKVTPSGSVPDKRPDRQRQGTGKQKKRKRRRFARSHIDHLTRIAHEAHRILEARGSPFRICIYEKEGDVFIDVITLDETGKPDEIFHQDISHRELEVLIHHIKSGRGLVFDARA